MKLVSPLQRGSTCTWRWPGTPAPAARPEVRADVHAVGLVRGADRPQRAHLRARDARRSRRRRDRRSSATCRIGATIRWPDPYGYRFITVIVCGGAFEHERFGVVGRVDEIADARSRSVACSASSSTRTPSANRPTAVRDSLRATGARATSAASRVDEVVDRDVALGLVTPPLVHADRAVLDVGVADDEDVRHLLGLRPPDARAELPRAEPSTISARKPSAFNRSTMRNAVRVVAVAHRQHRGLHRREPRRERAGVVLDEHTRRTARPSRTARGGS